MGINITPHDDYRTHAILVYGMGTYKTIDRDQCRTSDDIEDNTRHVISQIYLEGQRGSRFVDAGLHVHIDGKNGMFERKFNRPSTSLPLITLFRAMYLLDNVPFLNSGTLYDCITAMLPVPDHLTLKGREIAHATQKIGRNNLLNDLPDWSETALLILEASKYVPPEGKLQTALEVVQAVGASKILDLSEIAPLVADGRVKLTAQLQQIAAEQTEERANFKLFHPQGPMDVLKGLREHLTLRTGTPQDILQLRA